MFWIALLSRRFLLHKSVDRLHLDINIVIITRELHKDSNDIRTFSSSSLLIVKALRRLEASSRFSAISASVVSFLIRRW